MEWSANHTLHIGDIVNSEFQIAIADKYEIFLDGTFKTIGEATIRILGHTINTNSYNMLSGLVCFLPSRFQGCGIISIKITKINNKSVEGIPIDYIQNDKPFESYLTGRNINAQLAQTTDFPNQKRIIAQGY